MKNILKQLLEIYDPITLGIGLVMAVIVAALMLLPWLIDETELIAK